MPASTPSRSTQAGARHRERAEPIIFFLSSPPSPSVTAPLSSPSSLGSSSSASTGFLPCFPASRFLSTVPATRRQPSSPSLSSSVTVTSSPCPSAAVAAPSPASSSSLRLHRLSRPLHLHLSHVSIEHRPPLAIVALPALRQPPSPSSPAPPPSANCRPLPCVSPVEHHQSSTSAPTSLSLCRRRLLLFPFLASVATPSPVFPSSRHHPNRLRLLLLRLRRAPPVSLLPIAPAIYRRSPPPPPSSSPLCCRTSPPLPCSPPQPPSPSTSAPLLCTTVAASLPPFLFPAPPQSASRHGLPLLLHGRRRCGRSPAP